MRRWAPVVAVGAIAALGALGTPAIAAVADHDRAPVLRAPVFRAQSAEAVPGRYIVVLRAGASAGVATQSIAEARAAGGHVRFSYDAAISGFAATLDAEALKAVRTDPHVAYVEADQVVSVATAQPAPTWGLDRIDQRARPLNSSYAYDATGEGVTAYIIDSGVRATHSEFGGRVAAGYSAIRDGLSTSDCNGHGTHVAGTVGGMTYGVAKGVTLKPVRVLDCQGTGSISGVIAGIDWVTANNTGPAVANLSLGGPASAALDAAVQRSLNAGVTYAVAAGNQGSNACSFSPARVSAALTVGSSTSGDTRSRFSNLGACLDLFAPGSDIRSAWHTADTASTMISGTSMAAPHVAGVAALYLQRHPGASPATVSAALVDGATSNALTGVGAGSPNRLLHSLQASNPAQGGNLLENPGFESGATMWSSTTGVITGSSSQPPHTGSWQARLNGDGSSSTDVLAQSVTIPSSVSSAVLRFWLRIQSTETTRSTVRDRLRVQVLADGVTSTVASYSNLTRDRDYTERTVDLSAYRGTTVKVRFLGTEDWRHPTTFVLDDTSLTAT